MDSEMQRWLDSFFHQQYVVKIDYNNEPLPTAWHMCPEVVLNSWQNLYNKCAIPKIVVQKPKEKIKVRAAAIKLFIRKTEKTVVLCGCRHGDVFKQLKALGLSLKDFKIISQGFIDNNGKYYSRLELAIALGKKAVYSEDFW